MSAFDVIIKLGISAVAVGAFIVPEPASSLTGITILGALWGFDLLDGAKGEN